MKKSFLLFCFCFPVSILFAQTGEIAPAYTVPETYVKEVNVGGTLVYKPGETIHGSIEIQNFGLSEVSGLNFSLSLAGGDNNLGQPSLLANSVEGHDFSVGGKATVKLDFDYVLPKNYAGKDMYLFVNLLGPKKDVIRFGKSPIFEITGEQKYLTLFNVGLKNNKGESFAPLHGPSVYDPKYTASSTDPVIHDLPTSLSLLFGVSNKEGSTALDFMPRITYQKKFKDAKTLKVDTEPSSSLAAGKEKNGFVIPLPSFEEPGVYEGLLELVDKNGVSIGQEVQFQWVVGGLFARIDSVLHTMPERNQIEISASIPGIPMDMDNRIGHFDTPGVLTVQILDKKNTVITEDIYESPLIKPYTYKHVFQDLPSGALKYRLSLVAGDKTLDTYEGKFFVRYDTLFLLGIGAGIIILSLLVILFFFRKRHPKITIIGILFGTLLFCITHNSYFVAEAKVAPYGTVYKTGVFVADDSVLCSMYPYSHTFSSPLPTTYSCGSTISVAGEIKFVGCANTPVSVTVNGQQVGGWDTNPDAHYTFYATATYSQSQTLPSTRGSYAVPVTVAISSWCEYPVQTHYQYVNVDCCAGPVPQNADKCPNTEGNYNNKPVAACTGAKECEYDCIVGYIPDIYPANDPVSVDCRLPICLVNTAAGVSAQNTAPANSYVLSTDELPPSLKLTQDYLTTLAWSILPTQYTVAEINRTGTVAGCEYTCTDGYIPDGASSCRLPVCKPNATIGVAANDVAPANASPLTTDELPSSLKLVRDYDTTLIADPTKRTELALPDGCQYSCNDGFKIGPLTATAESNTAGTFAKIMTGGSGYTTPPTVTITGGTCTTPPTGITTINSGGSIDSLTLTGAVNCTAAPTITISAPTDTVRRCVADQCLGFAKPTNATYCTDDTILAGHVDQLNTHRADTAGCTSNQKCEWFCPADNPYFCETANTCVKTQNDCGGTPITTCKTSAPSELKTTTDYPLIQCDALSSTSTDTHFRYKITKTGGTTADTYTSPLFTIGTSVKHPTTFYSGTYTVTCLYGSAANTNATLPDYGMTAGTCTKTMTANDTANGCSRIYPYRGSTLSDELTSASAFDASFRCGSRESVTSTTDTKAYRLQVATSDPSFLAYDRNITDLFSGLAIGPVSTQTQNYNFNTGADITCAAKVGDGYSTNSSCQARACVGGACATPQSFIVVPSEEVTCTNQDSISYDVGCNPSSPDYTECLQWMYQDNTNTTNINGVETYNRNAKIKVNNVEQDIYFQCRIETPPGALGPVKTCTMQLPSGGAPVTIFAGDATTTNNTTNYSFQTTAYTLRKDTGKPTGTIAYYTNYSNGVTLSQDQYEYWQKQPITAVITCTDKASTTATGEPTTAGETDGSGCACSNTLTTNNATPTAAEQLEIDQWSLGIPSSNTNIGPDVMTYSRVIANMNNATTTPPAVKVQDSANNKSTQSFQPDFGIDSTPPRLTASKTADSVTLNFVDNSAGDSGIWKFSDNIPVGTGILKGGANNAILYRIGSKNNLAALEFGADCSPLPVKNTNYYKYKEVPAAPGTQTLTLPSFDVNNNIVAYCIQDNAGNINRGYYPNNLMGCFASTAMPTIPTLSPSTLSSHYAPLLKTKFASTTLTNNEKYGYSFSENPTNASCFRGILSNNITTLVTNQLNPRPAGEVTLTNWTTQLSTIKNTTTPNTNGYYYYSFSANTNNTVTVTPPTGTGTKNVIVDGGNIQINSNIEYTGSGKTLLLIARKNNAGQGGNIYINPTVTRIDAIIIADGGTVMNGTTTAGTTTTKNWISNASDLTNRLTINGRLYSYNTRGGSITPQATPGTDFDPITGNIGKYFDTNSTNATQLITTASPTQAATYDLERLRVMLSDGNSQCTTQVNYQAMTTANLPALLIKPSGFTGGNCSF